MLNISLEQLRPSATCIGSGKTSRAGILLQRRMEQEVTICLNTR